MPLVDTAGAVTGSFFFLGFRISRLLRLCPLAMMSSCTNPIRPLRSVKNERPRYLDEAQGQQGAGRLIRQNAAASFVSSRQYLRGRLGGSDAGRRRAHGTPRPPALQSGQNLEVVGRHLAALAVGDELEAHLLTFAQVGDA